jgi:hypothetical protein
MIRTTHTSATLELDPAIFYAIVHKLKEAGPEYLERYMEQEKDEEGHGLVLKLHWGGEITLLSKTYHE